MSFNAIHENEILPKISKFTVYENAVFNGEQEKKPLFTRGPDRKIRPSRLPFVITRQASWCQMVILRMEFSITIDFYNPTLADLFCLPSSLLLLVYSANPFFRGRKTHLVDSQILIFDLTVHHTFLQIQNIMQYTLHLARPNHNPGFRSIASF